MAQARRRRLMVRGTVVAVVAVCVWAALWSPLLAVRSVRVVGERRTRPNDVAAAAGIDSHANILLVSTDEIADRVEALPWVRRAAVDKMLPGTLRVRVRERRPAMVLSLSDETWTIDAHGRVLGTAPSHDGYPVLAGAGGGGLKPGMQVSHPGVRDGLRVWRELPRRLRSTVRTVLAPSPERITLLVRGDVQVRYGAAERLDAKNEVLGALLARVADGGVDAAYIDVRVPTSPAIGGSHDGGGQSPRVPAATDT